MPRSHFPFRYEKMRSDTTAQVEFLISMINAILVKINEENDHDMLRFDHNS